MKIPLETEWVNTMVWVEPSKCTSVKSPKLRKERKTPANLVPASPGRRRYGEGDMCTRNTREISRQRPYFWKDLGPGLYIYNIYIYNILLDSSKVSKMGGMPNFHKMAQLIGLNIFQCNDSGSPVQPVYRAAKMTLGELRTQSWLYQTLATKSRPKWIQIHLL